MAKQKNHKPETEQLREELRTCKSTVKHLKKELARSNRGLHRLSDLEEILQESVDKTEVLVYNKEKSCEECGAEASKVAGKSRVIHQADCSQRKKR